jgi:hypothetical protein
MNYGLYKKMEIFVSVQRELCLFHVDVPRAIARKTRNETRDDAVPL